MRLTFLFVVASAAVPAVAVAKGPSFADLVSELALPPRVQPGASFEAQAKIDVAAFCRRTMSFAGPGCQMNADAAAGAQAVLTLRSTTPDTDMRISDLSATLTRDAAGIYHGTFTTLPCQKPGPYQAATTEPNPAVTVATFEIASTSTCDADRTPPRIARVLLPARTKLPDHIPQDATEWGQGRLVVEVEDDATGPMNLAYELTPAAETDSSFGGRTLDCVPCGTRWTCSAEVPLCAPGLGDTAVRISWVRDRAGRQSAWFPLTGAPFAIAHCGADDAPAPVPSCPAAPAPAPDAGAPADAGSSAPPDAGAPPPVDAVGAAPPADAATAVAPGTPKSGGSSGCSSGGDAPASLTALVLLLTAAAFTRTLLRRRRS